MAGKTLSMTGFGSAEGRNREVSLAVEIRGVNHKFLDIAIKMPRAYTALESNIKSAISKEVERGRVEISIQRTPLVAASLPVSFNQALFDRYLTASTDVLRAYGGLSEETIPALLFNLVTNREFLSINEDAADLEKESSLLKKVLAKAIKEFVEMRRVEGKALSSDVLIRVKKIGSLLSQASTRAGQTPQEKALRLKERLGGLGDSINVEPHRLAQELALIADKIDVSEELARIKSHLSQIGESLGEAPQGRKLDFIIQELFREWNTIGSKAQDSKLQRIVVEAKVEIERLREQVQNIE